MLLSRPIVANTDFICDRMIIVNSYSFSLSVKQLLGQYLHKLDQLNILISKSVFSNQLYQLSLLNSENQEQCLHETLNKGWKSLRFSIEKFQQNKYETARSSSMQLRSNKQQIDPEYSNEVF